MRNFSKTSKVLGVILALTLLASSIFALAGCNYCAHNLEVIEKVPSTCVEHGHGYSYKCKKCGKLFGYSLEKELYEITEAEQLPLGEHTLSDELSVQLKDGKTEAESIWDFEVVYKCALCGKAAPVPQEHLATIVPPNIPAEVTGVSGVAYNGDYKYSEDGIPYTEIKFSSKTTPGEIELNPTKYAKPTDGKIDKTVTYNEKYEWVYSSSVGAYQRFPLYMPFNANETRHAFFFIKNTTDVTKTTDPLKIEWCIDGHNWASVTLAPGEIKPLAVSGMLDYNNNLLPARLKVSNPNNEKRLNAVMNIEMTGVYYIAGTVAKLDIDNPPDKTEYAEGEKFDPTGLKIYATYTDYCLGKTLRIEDCEFSCGDKPLTKADTKITVAYGGQKVSFNITVA